jgi:hypothetical protein
MAWENSNDVVYDVAKRAKELCDMSIDDLRLMGCSDPEGRLGSARAEFVGCSKGDLVEQVLVEEFIEDIPRDLEEM